jgi:hypothetical protein
MRSLHSLVRALAFVAGFASPVLATDFFVFKAGVTLPTNTVIERPSEPTDTFLTRKIGNKELVNLALGRALGTKVDGKTEILALAITYDEEAEKSRLIVFDPSQNGTAQIKATLATVDGLSLQCGFKSSSLGGWGTGSATFVETTIGDAAQFALLPSTLTGGASGSGVSDFGKFGKVSGKGVLAGTFSFRFTDAGGTRVFDGLVVNGKFKASGKPIGTFTE